MFNINLIDSKYYKIKEFLSDDVIYSEGDYIDEVGIILEGEIVIKTTTIDGFSYEIQRFKKNNLFADSLILLDNPHLPGDIISYTDSKILFISKRNFKYLLENNHDFLSYYLLYNSKRMVNMQEKIKLLAQPSIKEKILFYIKEEMIKQNSKKIYIRESKEKLAVHLGLNRPSLSRELKRMKENNIIDYDRYSITYLK